MASTPNKAQNRKGGNGNGEHPEKGGQLYPRESCYNGSRKVKSPLIGRFPGNGPRPKETQSA